MLIGVDIGGTFTDLVISEDGQLRLHKLLSTPANPAAGMLAGLAAVGAVPDARIAHGSTVATNAILERKGARTALITTQGFRDVLAIGRQNRPVLYALAPHMPPPLIPRDWRFEVPERLDYTGQIITPLDIAALDQVLDQLVAAQIESVAVCFLYSYLNPVHEQLVRQRMLARGLFQPWQISLSSDVLPEFREYERTSTVALDAYVRPVMNRYLQQLEDQLPALSHLLMMKSDGGIAPAARMREQAIQTALSGPAAGVIGAFHLAQLAGYDQIITLDMGGTSTDVALCPGILIWRQDTQLDGLPLRIRLIDIETVGAGGGSLARIDTGGALRVGPASAGATPGPIIYGQGGTQLTVSDANAVLGRLDPDHFLGGTMALHLQPAQQAMAQLAAELHLTAAETAAGILQIANTNIERAVRRVSIERGYDPRDFTLVAFGGAGPLHACEVAARLEIPRVLIPRYPGVMCALGLLVADAVREYSHTVLQLWTEAVADKLTAQFEALAQHAHADLQAQDLNIQTVQLYPLVDLRYQGQAYELTLPFHGSNTLADFHQAHTEQYGYAMPTRPVEVVNMRLRAVGVLHKPYFTPDQITPNDGQGALIGTKNGMALYARDQLLPGAAFRGECLIVQLDSTAYIPAGWRVRVDQFHHLIVENFS